MKSIRLVMRLGLCLMGVALLPTSGHAQFYQPTHNTSIQIEYREPIPANGDMTALRQHIYGEIQKDCDAAAKAFRTECSVVNISFNDIAMGSGLPPQGVIARAQLVLTPKAGEDAKRH